MAEYLSLIHILTDTYSPAAMDKAPATRAATVANTMGSRVVLAAATPMARLDTDMMPSLAPSTAALSQLLRCMSVSYTHLDVYKRQVLLKPLTFSLPAPAPI